MDTNKIEWRPVNNFPDYLVSTTGLVKSLKSGKEHILQSATNGPGYLQVNLYLNGKAQRKYVHRLVAEAFLSDYTASLQVNHLDEVKTNNNVTNLEMVTAKENVNYGTRNERVMKKLSKSIKCTTTGQIFESQQSASRQLGISRQSIYKVLKGLLHHTQGLHFEYVNF